MVFLTLPTNYTEEEELLLQKYAKLKKKKKALAAMKTPKVEKQESVTESLKRPVEAAADATEQAKKLLKLGAIKVEPDRREQHTFKRMKRQKDSEKLSVGFHPFTYSGSSEGPDDRPEAVRPKPKFNLYDNFVSASDSRGSDVGERHDRRQMTPSRGNTVYVHGHGVTEEVVKRAFSGMGTIVHINVEEKKNCAFVTFEKMESADQAISEINGSMVSGVQLKVSMARHQPLVETPAAAAVPPPPPPAAAVSTGTADSSSNTWSSIAASNSQKGAHHDNRDLVTYDEELF